MCDICNGISIEEQFEKIEDDIDEHGFSLMAVEAGPDHPPWTYTIGLVERFGHPELSLLGVPLAVAYLATSRLAERVVAGKRIEPGVDVFVDGVRVHVGRVGEGLWEGDMFAMWHRYYDVWADDVAPPSPSALELVPCGHDAAPSSAPGPSRAKRRKQQRRRRQARHQRRRR